jgi:hypothetical protein
MDADSPLPNPNDVRLSHGGVRFVLLAMRFAEEEGEAALDATLKALRRAGVPFGTAAPGGGGGKDLVYGADELAELVVALGLLEQGVRLRHVGMLFMAARSGLRPLLREAMAGAGPDAGGQADVTVRTRGIAGPVPPVDAPMRIRVAGLWLDWPTVCRPSGILEYRPPRLVGPGEAVALFMRSQSTLRFRPPLPITDLLATALALTREVPRIRRGRRPGVPQGPRPARREAKEPSHGPTQQEEKGPPRTGPT